MSDRFDDEDPRDHEPDGEDVAVAEDPLGPPEPTFWQRYNPHLEFPTSILISVLSLSLVFAFIVAVLVAAMLGSDRKPVPISLVVGGDDESGEGSPGSGGQPDPLAIGQTAPTQQDREQLALPQDLPQVKDDIQRAIEAEDPTSNVPLPDDKAAAYGTLDKQLRDKLLGIGGQKGAGSGPGKGDSGQAGSGPGGTGPDSTRARSIRWVLRFRTAGGRDYLNQIMALRGVILVPVEGTNKQMYIFRDLANPRPGTIASDSDIAQLSRQIQFSDFRRASVQQVGEALGLGYTPKVFWAFFPADLEAELARLEVAYRNRRPENIEETVFEVTVRGGQYSLVVAEQRAKH